MKYNKIISGGAILLLAAFLTAGCGKTSSSTDTKTTASTETKEGEVKKTENTPQGEVVKINLPSMQCNTCKKNIETALKKVEGVNSATVSVKEKTATVDYDKSKLDINKIEDTITAAGYDANGKTADKKAYEELDDCCKKPADQKMPKM